MVNRKDFIGGVDPDSVPTIGGAKPKAPVGPRINVISVQQPWAAALFFGKRVENRSWSTNCLGPMCIHASKKFDNDGLIPCIELLGKAANKEGFHCAIQWRGAIIGVKDLEIVSNPEYRLDEENEWAMPGSNHWVFSEENSVLFKRPIACKGQLRIWSVASSIIAEILADKGEAGIPPWLKDELPEPLNKDTFEYKENLEHFPPPGDLE